MQTQKGNNMNYRFENGAIVVEAKWYEKVQYDMSNAVLSATLNGMGGFLDYRIINDDQHYMPQFLGITYNGVKQGVFMDKKVTMQGRRQTIEVNLEPAVLKLEYFLDEKVNGIFMSYALISDRADDTLKMNLTYFPGYLENCKYAFTGDCEYIWDSRNLTINLSQANPVAKVFVHRGMADLSAEKLVAKYDEYRDALEAEIAGIRVPKGLTEEEKALFFSTYYCSLENYKELGEYRGFMAGCRYLSPMRTYYRDSYFTILPMYNGQLDKVRSQIYVLAKGISADGTCPSAVRWDWSKWWGNHYDSPSFLAMMLYDYIHFTGDVAYADVSVGEATIFEQVIRAIEKLAESTDETGLLVKPGRFNKQDWADEVCRYGYVTYDIILFARALYCIAMVCKLRGENELSASYMARYEKVRKAMDDILWDDELGYYVNYKNEDYTETNLSIDTVFAAIFDIADEAHAKSMLQRMEQMLESQNNGTPDPYGAMCVYPFYTDVEATCRKSSQAYNYHNGGNWPYLTAMYAHAKRKFGMEYKYLLTGWFTYNLNNGNYTPIEYFSSYCEDGSLLQAWSGDTAFVLDEELSKNFW